MIANSGKTTYLVRKNSYQVSKKNIKPTDGELEILQILWRNGPSTVRMVHEVMSARKDVGYTTTLKLMQIMAEKGLVKRNTETRQHIYTAAIAEQVVQKGVLEKIIKTTFRGSASGLIMQALGQHKTSPEELEQIKAFIEQMESKRK